MNEKLTLSASGGALQTLAAALVGLGISEWQRGNQLVGAVLLVAGGVLYIASTYLQAEYPERLLKRLRARRMQAS